MIDSIAFQASFKQFNNLLKQKSGESFTRFDRGLVHDWESYKPKLRDHALKLMAADGWAEADIGAGAILECVISAIEIQSGPGGHPNNLVFWQNRFGHAQRDHRAFLEARSSSKAKQDLERLLFGLYCTSGDESTIFSGLARLTNSKYPLLAYLYFLKDMDRFMPIQPTGFDRVFNAVGIELTTLRNCSWENYREFNAVLSDLRVMIENAAGISGSRLVDAHSFLWVYSTLLKQEASGVLGSETTGNVRYLDDREKSIAEIKYSIAKTTFNSNGQIVQRTVKDKELRLTDYELDTLLREMFDQQENCCAITGLPFQFSGSHNDPNMLPSLDRIDSDGHYERDNLQLVCRFINFWKQAADDGVFRRLINVVRGIDLG